MAPAQIVTTLVRMPRLVRLVLPLAILLAFAPSAQAKDFLGITSEDVFGGDAAYRAANLSQQRELGVGLLRQTFTWSLIETRRGKYNFARYDDYMLATASAHMKVLPILFGPPRFAAKRRSGTTCPPTKNSSFAAFARAVVKRYGKKGTLWKEHPEVPKTPLTSFQIWNEPLLKQYSCNKPSAKKYVAMLKTVGGAIKRAQPGAEIVTAGLPPSKLSGAVPFQKYMRQMYAAGAKRYFDTMAINSYAQGPAQLGRLMNAVRGTMNGAGDRGAKIWITELGWGDVGPKNRFIVGPEGQAKNITGSFSLIAKNRKAWKLRGVVYFSWRDGFPYAPKFKDLWGLHTGLLTVRGVPKPAFEAFRKGAQKLR